MTMDAAVAGLIGAVIGAGLSLMGTLVSGWQESKLERAKWLRAREDQAIKDLRIAVADLARRLAAGVHSIEWLTWPAKYQSDDLTVDQLDDKIRAYNQEVHGLFSELTGCLVVIAALDRQVYEQMRSLVQAFSSLDADVAMAASARGESLSESIEALVDCHAEAGRYFDSLHEAVAGIVDARGVTRLVSIGPDGI
jgi:hypothetical protein